MKQILNRKLLLSGIGLAVVIVAVVFFLRGGNLDPDTYQAVFLTNNQVYFGKLSGVDSSYPLLRDVYYLQLARVLQAQDINAPSQEVRIIKLGSELHGPTDEMILNRDHILFFENLRPDSKVIKSIEEFQSAQTQDTAD